LVKQLLILHATKNVSKSDRMNIEKLNTVTMKITKPDIRYLGQLILTWTFLNLSLNMIGLFITKMLNEAEFSYIDSVKTEFVMPLVIQSLLFTFCIAAAYQFLKNRKYADYVFVAFQFVMFHIIFFLNLKIHHGMHFESTFSNIGVRYLSNGGQYLVDILYLYFPINGMFDNGLFKPDNLGTFYIHWILLNIIYYIGLTWISIRVAKFFFEDKPEVPVIQKDEESIETETE